MPRICKNKDLRLEPLNNPYSIVIPLHSYSSSRLYKHVIRGGYMLWNTRLRCSEPISIITISSLLLHPPLIPAPSPTSKALQTWSKVEICSEMRDLDVWSLWINHIPFLSCLFIHLFSLRTLPRSRLYKRDLRWHYVKYTMENFYSFHSSTYSSPHTLPGTGVQGVVKYGRARHLHWFPLTVSILSAKCSTSPLALHIDPDSSLRLRPSAGVREFVHGGIEPHL